MRLMQAILCFFLLLCTGCSGVVTETYGPAYRPWPYHHYYAPDWYMYPGFGDGIYIGEDEDDEDDGD